MSAWSASIRGVVAMSHSSTSSPIRCWGWMLAHSLAAMIFWYSVRSLANSVAAQVVLLLWWWAHLNRKCHTKERNCLRVCINKRISHSSEIKVIWGRRWLCMSENSLVLFFWSAPFTWFRMLEFLRPPLSSSGALCKCSGKIKMTENAVLSSGSEGVSNTPVII